MEEAPPLFFPGAEKCPGIMGVFMNMWEEDIHDGALVPLQFCSNNGRQM